MISATTRAWFMSLFLCRLLLVPPATGAQPPPPEPEVICPAIRIEGTQTPDGQSTSSNPQPELVVLGKAKELPNQQGRFQFYEVQIDRVLSGCWKKPTIQFSCESDRGFLTLPDAQQIYALAPSVYRRDRPYQFRYWLNPGEESAVRALAKARLDFNALVAVCIFVGKEVKGPEDNPRTVEVVRNLAGVELTTGKRVTAWAEGYRDWNETKTPQPEGAETIYFVHRIKHDTKNWNWDGPGEKPPAPYYIVNWHQPVERETEVREALKRRDTYPVIETDETGKKGRYREVLFGGTTAEAIELLASASTAAQSLGERKLVHDRRAAQGAVVKAIEQRLVRVGDRTTGDHHHLKNLIHVLGIMCELDKDTEAVERLIHRHIEFIGGHPPALPRRETGAGQLGSLVLRREELANANHGLTWLAQQMNEHNFQQTFGPRLLKLRDQVKDGWKQEVQLALDLCRVEDQLELDAGLKRMKDAKPARSAPAIYQDEEYVLAFSHDGKHLATGGRYGVYIWSTRDWRPEGRFELENRWVNSVQFSPDDKLLYVAGGGFGTLHFRYDWRTGKLDRQYAVERDGVFDMSLSADGKRMVTRGPGDNEVHLTDTETGKVLQSFFATNYVERLAISPDGDTLIFKEHNTWLVASYGGPKPKLDGMGGSGEWLFHPDGRHLVSMSVKGHQGKETVTLRVHDGTRGCAVVASRTDAAFGTQLTISGDGKRLAVVRIPTVLNHGTLSSWPRDDKLKRVVYLTFLSLPKLETISTAEIVTTGSIDFHSIALSPDGKIFAGAAPHRITPYLIDVDTGKRITPTEGHTDQIQSIHFPLDGKTVRTIGWDNHICLWEAATMRLQRRVAFDDGLAVLGVREPDGRYLVCRDSSTAKGLCQVIDADTGKSVCSVTLPEPEEFTLPLFVWLNGHEAAGLVGNQLIRFDYLTGKVLKTVTCADEARAAQHNHAMLTDNGKAISWTEGGIRQSLSYLSAPESKGITFRSLDLETGNVATFGDAQSTGHYGPIGKLAGMIPGDRYCYVLDDSLQVLDRRAFEVVAEHPFLKTAVLALSFTADGKRFAVVTHPVVADDRNREEYDPKARSMIRIYETLSGKMLGAVPASTRWLHTVRFSPDGQRLAVLNTDGTIELWDLPRL